MDEAHLYAAIRYVSLNPVRARLVARAQDWPWSSVRAHLARRDDGVVTVAPVLERVDAFAALLDQTFDEPAAFAALRRAETTGRPLGSAAWVKQLERDLARSLAPRRRGPKPKEPAPEPTQDDLLSKLSP
jgi:putative transposase